MKKNNKKRKEGRREEEGRKRRFKSGGREEEEKVQRWRKKIRSCGKKGFMIKLIKSHKYVVVTKCKLAVCIFMAAKR